MIKNGKPCDKKNRITDRHIPQKKSDHRPVLRRLRQKKSIKIALSSSQLRADVPPERARVEEEVKTNATMEDILKKEISWRGSKKNWPGRSRTGTCGENSLKTRIGDKKSK